MSLHEASHQRRLPEPSAILALLKPVTWFPPMWAFGCGALCAGVITADRWTSVALGIVLAGPLLCGTSQAVNDWFDRHVDAINEPDRVIPSGRMPGRWGLYIAIINSCLSMLVAWFLGPFVFMAAALGLALAWAYSAPPFRFKKNGWIGNAAVGLSYETLPWLTAAAAILGGAPSWPIVIVALLYGIGAHGIMTINDFKAIEGDRQMGIASLPVQLGTMRAAQFTGLVMIVPQVAIAMLLSFLGSGVPSLLILGLVVAQIIAIPRFLRDPVRYAVWYSAVGVGLFVSGMIVAAIALRALSGSGGG